MFPILFQFGPFSLSSFSLFVLIAIVVAGFVIWKKAQDEDLEAESLFDFVFLIIIGALIFGRLVYVLLALPHFAQDPLLILLMSTAPGFSFWGMVVGGYLAGFAFARYKKLPFLKYGDICAIGFSWAQVFIFLAHIFAGSFYGKPTQLFWGIELVGLLGRRHPTQFLGLAFSIFLLLIIVRVSRRVHVNGLLIYAWLILNALFLAIVDWLRGDIVYLGRVSANQTISLVALFVFTGLLYRQLKRSISSDLDKFWRFLVIFAKSLIYLIRKQEARKNLLFNLRYLLSKKIFAIYANIRVTFDKIKQVINVKKSKINR